MTSPTAAPRLLVQLRHAIRLHQYSPRTEEAYAGWVRRFVRFNGMRHPAELGAPEITRFLTHLASAGRVSASTQTQALSALLFLYRHVIGYELEGLGSIVRAAKPVHLPVVLTRDEVRAVLEALTGTPRLVAMLMYGSGLRLLEALQMRVKDLDFGTGEIVVRRGKGGRDRITMLAESVTGELKVQLEKVRRLHERDLATGGGSAPLPGAIQRKAPGAAREWGWQFVFPASRRHVDRASGVWYGITCTSQRSSGRSSVRFCMWAFPSGRRATASATRLRLIFFRTDMTSAPCRSCWGTVTWPRRWSIPMC